MLSALLLIFAAAPPVPQAPPTLDASYPGTAKADLGTLAADVIDCCREMWPGDPPAGHRPIVILYRAAGPLTDSTADPKSYRIYLNVTERYYSQFAYQLAHEFAHVMLDPRRTNGLVETLAVAFSLQALDEMSRRWKDRAPYPNWKPYAPEFSKYRKRTEQLYLKDLPASVQALAERKAYDDLGLYLRHRRSPLESETGNRELQHLASLAILAKGVRWRDLTGVAGLTDPPPAKDPRFRGDLLFAKGKIPALFLAAGVGREGDLLSVEFTEKPNVKGGLLVQEGARRWLWLSESKGIDGKVIDKLIRDHKPAALRWERGP
jgi:hypothetical protein